MSIHDPDPTELVDDRDFAERIEQMCRFPQMWVTPATLETVCAYLDGYDRGRSGGLLAGFREWLVVRLAGWNNFYWPGLTGVLLRTSDELLHDIDHNAERIKELGNLLKEFFAYRRSVGLTKLYFDYAEWLLKQEWYVGPLRTLAN